jgi:hypothetical protein
MAIACSEQTGRLSRPTSAHYNCSVLAPRSYLIEEYTKTVCPACFAGGPRRSDEDVWRDGLLVSRDGRVWLRRFCPEHGESESLYEEDLDIWRARAGFATPTLAITPDRPGNFAPFPEGYRDGLPASHGQHTCILLLNVTQRCNYACPTCYASAQRPGTPLPIIEHPTPDEISHTVRTMLEREGGKLGVLMLSGGEPTVREDLPLIIEQALQENITRVLINTNGRRITRDDRFLEFLREHRDQIEVYLQFDGFRSETALHHRAEDVVEEKLLALRRLQDSGIWTTLVMTVSRENQDEVGAVLQLGLETPRCAGLAIQPVFGSGRNPGFDGCDRVTPTGVLRRLNGQTGGLVSWKDFLPLPCSHRDCCDITYLLKTKNGQWQSLPHLLGRDELKKWLHLVANTISFEDASSAIAEMVKSGALQRIFSEQQKISAYQLATDIAKLCGCVQGLPELIGMIWNKDQSLEKLAERTFRVTVKMFMDAHTFHEARIRQCCVHSGTFEDDPRRYSFCWRWLFADAQDFPVA